MKSIRKRLSFANLMSVVAVFIALGGIAVAAGLPKNSVGKKQLKNNAVTTAKIKKNAVTTKKIKKGAINGSKVKNDSLTGTQINESTLGTVPSANTANVANNLAGLTRFNVKLGFGQSQVLVQAGVFTLTASCGQNTTDQGGSPNLDVARIVISTSANGKVFDASDAKRGENAGDFLDVTTPELDRIWLEETVETGKATYESESNSDGSAYDPNGVGLSVPGTGLGVGINVYGPGCFFHGFGVAT
jgi:hypothetical protein